MGGPISDDLGLFINTPERHASDMSLVGEQHVPMMPKECNLKKLKMKEFN